MEVPIGNSNLSEGQLDTSLIDKGGELTGFSGSNFITPLGDLK